MKKVGEKKFLSRIPHNKNSKKIFFEKKFSIFLFGLFLKKKARSDEPVG